MLFSLFACNGYEENGNPCGQDPCICVQENFLNSTLLEGFRANIAGATALGIAIPSVNARVNNFSSVALGNSVVPINQQNLEVDRNTLFKINQQGALEIIEFVSDNETLTQSDISAQVQKLHVTENFIFFNLRTDMTPLMLRNSRENHESQTVTYDQSSWDFFSRYHQGFMIDRNDGYIYSLWELGRGVFGMSNPIKLIEENHIIVGVKGNNTSLYGIEIVEGNAVFTSEISNPAIQVLDIYKGLDGILYVHNSHLDETVQGMHLQTNQISRALRASDERYFRVLPHHGNFMFNSPDQRNKNIEIWQGQEWVGVTREIVGEERVTFNWLFYDWANLATNVTFIFEHGYLFTLHNRRCGGIGGFAITDYLRSNRIINLDWLGHGGTFNTFSRVYLMGERVVAITGENIILNTMVIQNNRAIEINLETLSLDFDYIYEMRKMGGTESSLFVTEYHTTVLEEDMGVLVHDRTDYLLFERVGIAGTEIFILHYVNGEIVFELWQETTYESNIIVIRPL